MNDLTITQAVREDLPAILDVQKKAFLEVVRTFHLKSLPAIEQTLESLVEEFEHGIILKAFLVSTLRSSKLLDTGLRPCDDDDVIIVGSVRAYQKDDTCYIGRLVVLPEYQNQGIGKALMREIENQYKKMVKRYALFTGESDPRNRYLYDQLGYKPYKTKKLDDEITMVYLEKSAGR
jgi:ribosomal protein S18 acetylase RimI-like enzyme